MQTTTATTIRTAQGDALVPTALRCMSCGAQAGQVNVYIVTHYLTIYEYSEDARGMVPVGKMRQDLCTHCRLTSASYLPHPQGAADRR